MNRATPITRRRLVWHRRDLRLHDNELYSDSRSSSNTKNINNDNITVGESSNANEAATISLYVIDPSDFAVHINERGAAVTTTGPHACRALIGSLFDLRQRLEGLGGTLLIRRGDPLDIVPAIAAELDVAEVCWSDDPGYYESCLSQKLRTKLVSDAQGGTANMTVRTVSGYALYHPNDLPHGDAQWSALARPNEKRKKKKHSKRTGVSGRNLTSLLTDECNRGTSLPLVSSLHTVNISPERLIGMPRVMGDFRRAARTATSPRPCIEIHDPLLCKPESVEVGVMPTIEELTSSMRDQRVLDLPIEVVNLVIDSAMSTTKSGMLDGGETEALQRLSTFIDDGHAATAVRNLADVSGNNESANISTYLALGSLSPRTVFHRAAAAGDCDWLVSHMTMRDFFVYSAYKQGKDLFRLSGSPVHKAKGPSKVWKQPSEHMELFTSWATGATGLPLIDAGMKEMMSTGYCSNRVRQNMASVLTKDLELDWRHGAEWMQFCLNDHCVGANWGNWQYFGGVGADPKNRHFRTVSQAARYDPNGDYVKKWIPSLSDETNQEALFRPWDLVDTWKQPIVDPATQLVWQDAQRLETSGSLLESTLNNS